MIEIQTKIECNGFRLFFISNRFNLENEQDKIS